MGSAHSTCVRIEGSALLTSEAKLFARHFFLLKALCDSANDELVIEVSIKGDMLFAGLRAILNTLLFAIGGVLIPWLLADSWLGAPEVRSQQTDRCVDAWAKDIPENNTSVLSSILLLEAIWEACYGERRSNSYCDPNFADIEGYSLKIGTDYPFPAPICLRDQPTLTFTRANMTPHELSINSRLSMTVSHQITCDTISMDPFIYQVPSHPHAARQRELHIFHPKPIIGKRSIQVEPRARSRYAD
jgi:hypothetical protein